MTTPRPPRSEDAGEDRRRSRTLSSKLWLERQLNDPYVARAKREGFRSRAAYKLAEIDDKHRLLKPGVRVVDLGAAPGGWSQIAAKRVGAGEGRGRVVRSTCSRWMRSPASISCSSIFSTGGARQPQGDAGRAGRRRAVRHGGERDRPPQDRSSAHHGAGRGRGRIRARGPGAGRRFLAKVLQGGTEASAAAALKRDFASVKHVKPAASRADSAELYLLATGFRGGQSGQIDRTTTGRL